MKRKRIILEIVIRSTPLLLLFGCQDECNTNLITVYDTPKPPIIHIESIKDDHCTYIANINIWFENLYLSSKGELVVKDSAFLLDLYDPKINSLKYFDFTKDINDQYSISVSLNDTLYSQSITIENIVSTKSYGEVYIFRVKNGFFNYNDSLDIIFLCSYGYGIIGSYFYGEYEGINFMVAPSGDILENILDYSEIEKRTFK